MEAIMVRPQIKIEGLEGLGDPTFEAGSVHVARAPLTNPTVKEWTYDVELYLDVTKVASASGAVTIPAGGSVNVDFSVAMPLVEGEYEGWIDAWCVDAITPENPTGLIRHYHITENVIIVISPAIEIGEPTWV